ncbi:hypothetical protein [Rhizobium sp. LjRoot254]|uniref:hypothetical protein n=1 Tax=Rhizobium sp. LjRoot254 TaxID=3342297 RepID=UPI003ECC6CBC
MNVEAPTYSPLDPRREHNARHIFSSAARDLILQAVSAGWRESEAAMALADAADDYILYLAQKPTRKLMAANSN